MTDRPGLDFSFSGLKTFALTTLRDLEKTTSGEARDRLHADVARAFEEAVVDTLVIKCRRAVESSDCDTLVMAGGVSANRKLRQRVDEMMQSRGGRACYPRPELCTDNGAMIAYAGWRHLVAGHRDADGFSVRPRWPMQELGA